MATVTECFLRKITKQHNGCWIWIGATTMLGSHRNFPYVNFAGKQSHRVAWELFRGAIPRGLEIDHLCKITNCVNPTHLEPVTRLENVRRSSRYHPVGSKCCRGHLMVKGNFKIRKEGFKRCLLCMKEDNNQ